MRKFNLLFIILLLIIILLQLISYKLKKNDKAKKESFKNEVNESLSTTNSSKHNENSTSNWNNNSFNKLKMKQRYLNIDNKNLDPESNNLILNEKFAEEYPELYKKILDFILKSYSKNANDLEYTIKIENKNNKGLYSNLVNSDTTISPENKLKIEQILMEDSTSSGNCSLTYPHPSYAILNKFKSMSSCHENCSDKKSETGSCLPLAANCYLSKI